MVQSCVEGSIVKESRVKGLGLKSFNMFQDRTACSELRRSRVEMHLTYIIQKFSILRLSLSTGKHERKQG